MSDYPRKRIVKEDSTHYYILSFNGTEVVSSDSHYWIWLYSDCLYEYEGNGIIIHDGGMGSMRIEGASLYSLIDNELVYSQSIMDTTEYSFNEQCRLRPMHHCMLEFLLGLFLGVPYLP